MNNLDFVLFVCLFPVCTSLAFFLEGWRNRMLEMEKPSKTEEALNNAIYLFVWVIISFLLYIN